MQLAEWQADRKFFTGVINKQTNAGKAFVRRAQDWRYDGDESLRKTQNARAARIVAAVIARKPPRGEDQAVFAKVDAALMVFAKTLAPLREERKAKERKIIELAKALPAYLWVKSVPGFGDKALGIIIAEAGDLSNYPDVAKVWKRLGLAPFTNSDGVTKACSTWRRFGGLTKEEWTGDDGPGYSPRRRAEVYSALSDPLFRIQSQRSGPYRAVYDKRRAHTAVTHPDWQPMQSHMDGLRIMTKQVISDLWSEWRRASDRVTEKSIRSLPAAEIQAAPAKRKAA